ncbi:uncharacterized protein F4822DRAFT_296919 [Hypoxylon trugodes]|uniref:uncharacterized protein n=1 Tax=Hypoxylon trugodes TaxID=326681 RepID=UPI00219E0A15|nr:uncharacterized protein F4822DRAFT_296919 [Hypoxylon trugodes]KAI1387955.1 hypothetical protein F4822DRAFT_296919 [Hypoxylon trugodes]
MAEQEKYSHISRRAWVIQETVLGPRLLSFTDRQVIWQCSETAACEDFPEPEPIVEYNRSIGDIFWALTDFAGLLKDDRLQRAEEGIEEVGSIIKSSKRIRASEERWFDVLEKYSEAELTYPEKDIFKAIQGVGNHMARVTGKDYQHGILSGCLELTLLWKGNHRDDRQNPVLRDSSLAPSWHWASYSMSSSVDFDYTLDLYDMLRDFNCRFAPLAYVFMSDDCDQLATRKGARDLWPNLMCIGRLARVVIDRANGWPTVKIVASALEKTITLDASFDAKHTAKHGVLTCLPLIIQYKRDGTDYICTLEGLLLRESGKGRYERVGTVKKTLHDSSPRSWNRIFAQPPKLFILN